MGLWGGDVADALMERQLTAATFVACPRASKVSVGTPPATIMMLMSALHCMLQYPHGRPCTAGALSYGRGAVVAEPGSSRRRAGVTAGGAVVALQEAAGRRRSGRAAGEGPISSSA